MNTLAHIEVIDHKEQRYETCGDWYQGQLWGEDGGSITTRGCDGGTMLVKVSKLGDWRYEVLVGVHELVEGLLCQNAGISEEEVTAFDVDFEKQREARFPTPNGFMFYFGDRLVPADQEPGDCIEAPYFRHHQGASCIERMLAQYLDVDWHDYEKTLTALGRDDDATSTPS